MFVAGGVTKGKGFCVDPFKEKNQHRTLNLDPQRLGQTHYKYWDGCY